MRIEYLVTTNLEILNAKLEEMGDNTSVCMLDGTVPGWEASTIDIHFDHHRPGGGLVQIDEMPELDAHQSLLSTYSKPMGTSKPIDQWLIVTTLCDADAAVAAAWAQITREDAVQPDFVNRLRAIALDCDYLLVPSIETDDRKVWMEEDKVRYYSEMYKRATEWLISAVRGERPWPGESG